MVYNFDFVYISYCLKLVFVFNWNVVYICYIVNILSALSQSVLLSGGCPLIKTIQEGITRYDTHRWTALMTDWARQGLGYVMCQKYCSCTNITPNCCSDSWKVCMVVNDSSIPGPSFYEKQTIIIDNHDIVSL